MFLLVKHKACIVADILDKFTKAELRRILRGDLKNQYGDEYDAHIKMLDNQKKGIQNFPITKKRYGGAVLNGRGGKFKGSF